MNGRTMVRTLCLFLALISPAGATTVVRVLGAGDDIRLDPRSIPVEIQTGYRALTQFCLECHGEERIITTLRTGKSPVTRQPYGEREFREKIVKVLRSSKTDLNRDAAKELLHFFTYLINRTRIE